MNKNDTQQLFLDSSLSGCCLVLFYTSPFDLKPRSAHSVNPQESFISAGPLKETLGHGAHNLAHSCEKGGQSLPGLADLDDWPLSILRKEKKNREKETERFLKYCRTTAAELSVSNHNSIRASPGINVSSARGGYEGENPPLLTRNTCLSDCTEWEKPLGRTEGGKDCAL